MLFQYLNFAVDRRKSGVCVFACHSQRSISKTIVQKFAPFAYKFSHVKSIVCAHDAFAAILLCLCMRRTHIGCHSAMMGTHVSLFAIKKDGEKSSHKNETGAPCRSKVEANRKIAANERKSRKINFLCRNICLVCCAVPLPRPNCSYLPCFLSARSPWNCSCVLCVWVAVHTERSKHRK